MFSCKLILFLPRWILIDPMINLNSNCTVHHIFACIEVCRIAAEEVELNIFKFTWLPELLSSLCSGICEQSSNICITCRDSCSVHCWSSRWSTTPADQTFRERGAGRGWRGRGDSGSWRMLTPWILHPTLFQDKTKFHPMRLQCCTWWDTC